MCVTEDAHWVRPDRSLPPYLSRSRYGRLYLWSLCTVSQSARAKSWGFCPRAWNSWTHACPSTTIGGFAGRDEDYNVKEHPLSETRWAFGAHESPAFAGWRKSCVLVSERLHRSRQATGGLNRGQAESKCWHSRSLGLHIEWTWESHVASYPSSIGSWPHRFSKARRHWVAKVLDLLACSLLVPILNHRQARESRVG